MGLLGRDVEVESRWMESVREPLLLVGFDDGSVDVVGNERKGRGKMENGKE
jgi:hypothetical protein